MYKGRGGIEMEEKIETMTALDFLEEIPHDIIDDFEKATQESEEKEDE